MTTPNNSAMLTAVAKFVEEFNRPCPMKHLFGVFGNDALEGVEELKKSGALVGLRGRNGGLALSGSQIVTKRSEYAAKKAAKVQTAETAVNG